MMEEARHERHRDRQNKQQTIDTRNSQYQNVVVRAFRGAVSFNASIKNSVALARWSEGKWSSPLKSWHRFVVIQAFRRADPFGAGVTTWQREGRRHIVCLLSPL
jgi:hypothetical protein